MTRPSIAITGIGVLSPLGDTFESVAAALEEGRRAIVASSEGDFGEARIPDFDAGRYATIRGMRVYNRTTQLGICAAKRALDDARLDPSGPNGEGVGVITASTVGHLDTLIDYDRSLLKNGIARTNPALRPLAIASAPGAAAALAFNAKAFSITLSDGGTSSLDAIGLAARLLAEGRARTAIVIGSFSPCRELTASAARGGSLSPADRFRVLDRRREGFVFGEVAVAFVLEPRAIAEERGVKPFAFVRAHRSTFGDDPANVTHALARACKTAIEASSLRLRDVGLVSSGANGSREGDRIEAEGLLEAFGETAPRAKVTAVKANLGESLDASGMLQSLVALSAMIRGSAPGIPALEEPEIAGLDYLGSTTTLAVSNALVTSVSRTGSAAALVLSAVTG